MSSILLKNIELDGRNVDISIQGKHISRISASGTLMTGEDCEVVECSGKVAVPGFINMHTHAAMTLMRGVGEDMVFQEWINRIWDIESGIDADFIRIGTQVACLEMIRSGTTTFNDHYWYPSVGMEAAAGMDLGAGIAYILLDKGDTEEALRQKEQCIKIYEQSKNWDEDFQFTVGVHSVYSVTEEIMSWAGDFARNHGLRLHIHLSETEKEVLDCRQTHGGLSPVEYLDRLGVLGDNVIAAHTLWLSDKDIEILARRGVHCVHNINSNTKLSSGYRFLYNEMKDAGINICLGTDGCASSNNLDMLETMKTSALFQKAWREDPKAMPIRELMDMATKNAARALGINTGEIREGALADINIIDRDNTYFLSSADFLANLIYSAHSDCISSVISKGRFVMRDRVVSGEKEILAEARRMIGI